MSVSHGRDLSTRLMQLALAFFFLVLGIQEVVSSQQTDLVRGLNSLINKGADPRIDLIIGSFAILSAVLLLLGTFQMTKGRTVFLFTSVIMIYWAVRLVVVRFVQEITMGQGSLHFLPELETWLLSSSMDLIVLCALWMVLRSYSRE